MSIFPATDIVADVAQAADPQKARVAMRRLAEASRSANASGADFSSVLRNSHKWSANAAAGSSGDLRVHAGAKAVNRAEGGGVRISDAALKFEAYFLQSFLEVVLPKGDRIYGQGISGGIWRSMIAEQFGAQLAKRGVVGLDRIFERQFGPRSSKA
jgi:flagellar protein FlgJ